MDKISRNDEFQEILILTSQKYIDELKDASSYLIGQYGNQIKQFTIDFLDWHYGDYDDVSKDLPGSLLYKCEKLKEVFNSKLEIDLECIDTICNIIGRWYKDIEQRWNKFNQ